MGAASCSCDHLRLESPVPRGAFPVYAVGFLLGNCVCRRRKAGQFSPFLGKLPLKAAFLLFESVHYGFRAVSCGQFFIDRLEALSYSFDSGREPVA